MTRNPTTTPGKASGSVRIAVNTGLAAKRARLKYTPQTAQRQSVTSVTEAARASVETKLCR